MTADDGRGVGDIERDAEEVVLPHVETFHQLHDGTPIKIVCYCEHGTDHVTRPVGVGAAPRLHWRAPRRPVGF